MIKETEGLARRGNATLPFWIKSGRWLRARLAQFVALTVAVVLAVMFAGPFFIAISSSFKDPSELYIVPPIWIPKVIRWWNYTTAWTMAPFTRYFLNTITITVAAMIGQLASALVVAYGFARFRFPGRELLFMLVLITMIVPGEVTLIPQFLLFRKFGWIDTWWPLIVPAYFGGGAFSIFLLRQFLLTLPRELDEAATIDGASTLRILVQILMPLCKPALATLAIFSFMGHWNDFLGPLIYLNTNTKFTVSLGLRYFQGIQSLGGPVLTHYLMAASVMVTMPMVILFILLQRYYAQGIVMTGIKG